MPPSDRANPIQPGTAKEGEYNAQVSLVSTLLAKVNTSAVVKVVAVTNSGGLSPVGQVDVQPLVGQVDGEGEVTPHGVVHGLPYFRLQGGSNAVIIDPVVGDIGVALFASRDISSVKASKAASPPGSRRRFDMADGLYIGGFLNGTPTQFIRFSADGVQIKSPKAIVLESPTLTHNGVNIGATHRHGQVQSGGSTSGVPQ